ncbi:MAG: DNA-directed RNA polymerase subunit omega [Planctomycetota bacterium]
MLDIDVEDSLVKKVGGKIRLTSLIQKRMVELKRGARPLVEMRDPKKNLMKIIVQEILEDKIELGERDDCDTTFLDEVARRRAAEQPSSGEGAEREIYGSDIKKIKEQRIKELSALLNPTKK